MSDISIHPMQVFAGIAGNPAVVIGSVRTDPADGNYRARWEIVEGVSEQAALNASRLRVMELERDVNVLRIILAPVSSERRRKATEVFGKVVLPVNRVNGHS